MDGWKKNRYIVHLLVLLSFSFCVLHWLSGQAASRSKSNIDISSHPGALLSTLKQIHYLALTGLP